MSLPIVTIVGRPNVGKSTLFNRIIKRRDAIVDDQPGVTRDRHYAETEWAGQAFLLVDTGGYLPQTEDQIELAVREQVDIAIQEADILLYVADRATGVTDWDLQIAAKLKRSEKTVVLAINKVDNAAMESDIYEFYKLGLGEPLGISAMQGRNIGDLLDVLINPIRRSAAASEPQEGIRLAVVGRENVGKSSFVNTLLGENRSIVTDIPGTTRDPIDSQLNYQKRKYLLIDTAGLKRRARVKENILFFSQIRTLRSIQRADVVIYFLDAREGITRQDMRILQEAEQQRKGIVIAVNKWDLIPKDGKTMKEWETALREKMGGFSYIPLVFTSVLEKKRLLKLLDVATEVYENGSRYIRTTDLNKYFLPLVKETTPAAAYGKEIKINYVTQVRKMPPVFAFFCNFPNLISESYSRFLERKIRENWNFSGVPVTIIFKAKHGPAGSRPGPKTSA
ncbi:MAG: ribosome biogenesis GTPase Der [Calditrichia bacterium]